MGMRVKRISLALYVFILSVLPCQATSGGHRIWDFLFSNGSYNKNVRPVKDWTTPTTINMSVAIIAIVEFNEVKQTIVMTSKLTFSWTDEFLTWNPEHFDNVSHIHAPQSEIWRPYVVLENSVTRQTEIGTSSLNVIINDKGVVEWSPVEVFHTTCATDVRNFPFDVQKCSMVFEALGYKSSEMRMQSLSERVNFHEYGGTTGWKVMHTEMSSEVDEDGEVHVVCSITLKRNPVYFILNVFLPIVLLSLMNNCVFLLPVQSGEKASFVITVFLALAVFLTIVSGNLPENSDNTSILNVYVFMGTLLSVVIAIVTIIQIRLYHRNPNTPVPYYLIKLTKVFTSSNQNKSTAEVEPVSSDNPRNGKSKRKSIIDIRATIDENDIPRIRYNSFLDKSEESWPLVVRTLDNVFFFIFLLLNVIMTTATFLLAMKDLDLEEEDHADH